MEHEKRETGSAHLQQLINPPVKENEMKTPIEKNYYHATDGSFECFVIANNSIQAEKKFRRIIGLTSNAGESSQNIKIEKRGLAVTTR